MPVVCFVCFVIQGVRVYFVTLLFAITFLLLMINQICKLQLIKKSGHIYCAKSEYDTSIDNVYSVD